MKLSAVWLMVRPLKAGLWMSFLPLVAFSVIGSVVFLVAAMARQYWAESVDGYKVLSVALLAILVVPVATLGSSAARLAARRRDERLATLRLIGASAAWVRAVTATEISLLACAGTILGGLGYAGFAPGLSLLEIGGRRPTLASLWLPTSWLVALGAGITVVALVSALSGLRGVTISPLGVRARVNAPRLHWLRLVVSGAAIIGCFVVVQLASASWGVVGITAAVVVVLVVTMAVQNLAGPFTVGILARRMLNRASSAEQLIAARTLLESPQAAWRQVSGVALASFVVVPAGSILGFLNAVEAGPSMLAPDQTLFFADIRTVVVAAVAVAALLAVCSIGITQAAGVMERASLYVSLDRLGMPELTMSAARRHTVMTPVWAAVAGSAVVATVMVLPVVAVGTVTAPVFTLGVVVCLSAAVWILRLGVSATRPVLRFVLAHPERSL